VKAGRTIPYVIVVDRRPEPVGPEKQPEGPEGEFIPVRPGAEN
jgi:hypothetical protein